MKIANARERAINEVQRDNPDVEQDQIRVELPDAPRNGLAREMQGLGVVDRMRQALRGQLMHRQNINGRAVENPLGVQQQQAGAIFAPLLEALPPFALAGGLFGAGNVVAPAQANLMDMLHPANHRPAQPPVQRNVHPQMPQPAQLNGVYQGLQYHLAAHRQPQMQNPPVQLPAPHQPSAPARPPLPPPPMQPVQPVPTANNGLRAPQLHPFHRQNQFHLDAAQQFQRLAQVHFDFANRRGFDIFPQHVAGQQNNIPVLVAGMDRAAPQPGQQQVHFGAPGAQPLLGMRP